MKVVLFCGGLGMRLREFSEAIPKPMVPLGYRPILWHVMRYYAHYGHKDFILCLGHKADVIKSYFRNYDETISNDFILAEGGRQVELLAKDIQDWRITFVDTGLHANIGQRLLAVRPFLEGETAFLANYGDGLTDLPLPNMIEYFEGRDAVACFVGVPPTSSFHLVECEGDGQVRSIRHIRDIGLRVNGGFFILRQSIFDYMQPGEELVEQPFERLASAGKLLAYPHDGFWACMDTFKERQLLEDMYAQGHPPWEVWARNSGGAKAPPP